MRPILILALAGVMLVGCAAPDRSRDAARNLQSTQPDRSGLTSTGQAFSR